MKNNQTEKIRGMLLYTLFLFAAFSVIAGAIESIPEQTPISVQKNPETTEVFLSLPQEIPTGVFSSFKAPLKGIVTSPYGYRSDPFTGEQSYHNGVDLATEEGADVYATEKGTVKASAYHHIGGNYIIISHENGSESYYGHLQTRIVSQGDFVEQGDIIGLSGATGAVTGPHLHFQLTYKGRTIDPLRHIPLTP